MENVPLFFSSPPNIEKTRERGVNLIQLEQSKGSQAMSTKPDYQVYVYHVFLYNGQVTEFLPPLVIVPRN